MLRFSNGVAQAAAQGNPWQPPMDIAMLCAGVGQVVLAVERSPVATEIHNDGILGSIRGALKSAENILVISGFRLVEDYAVFLLQSPNIGSTQQFC
jgi:hypothetical protein